MKVKIAPAVYCGARIYEIEVDEEESVKSLKDKTCRLESIPTFMARLLLGEKLFDENTLIKSLGIKEGDVLQLIIMT